MMRRIQKDERGMALIMALLVVALLTISVVEFFYSAEVDSRMARNSVHSLQASLLARSGITLGEALLIKDQDFTVDSFLEDWCPSPAREGRACQIEDGGGMVTIPEGMRLRVEIWDESGKININFTRPRTIPEFNTALRTSTTSSGPANRNLTFQMWIDVFQRLLESRGINPDVATALEDYWMNYFKSQFGASGASPGVPTPTPTAGGGAASATPVPNPGLPLFASLDDLVGAGIGLTMADLHRLRPFLTAGPITRVQVNANTASREVLTAILGDGEAVENIITQRQTEPITAQTLPSLATTSNPDPAFRNAKNLLTSISELYLIRASAIVNINPITGRGGISRSAEMIVRRQRSVQPGVANVRNTGNGSQNQGLHWTLTRLYWQKEGGAVLFRPEVESGAGETVDSAGY